MIPRNAEVVEHRPVRPRIDIGGVPKSQATKDYEGLRRYLEIYGMKVPEVDAYVSAAEQERIWKLIEQFSVTSGDTREVVERSEPEGQLAGNDQDRRSSGDPNPTGMGEPERQTFVQSPTNDWYLD